MEFKLPNFETILEIHEIVIELYGGLSGIPHPEYIKAAIARPQNFISYSSECDIHLVAALILNSVATYHAFADGNKRTALLSMLMTYRFNDIYLSYDLAMNKEFEKLVLKVTRRKMDIDSIRAELKVLVSKYAK